MWYGRIGFAKRRTQSPLKCKCVFLLCFTQRAYWKIHIHSQRTFKTSKRKMKGEMRALNMRVLIWSEQNLAFNRWHYFGQEQFDRFSLFYRREFAVQYWKDETLKALWISISATPCSFILKSTLTANENRWIVAKNFLGTLEERALVQ